MVACASRLLSLGLHWSMVLRQQKRLPLVAGHQTRWHSVRSSAQKAHKVVVVESPSKAVKIQKFLGSGYKVVPSYGHVRDVDEAVGAVDPDNGFAIRWSVPDDKAKRLEAIANSLKGAGELVLATDPDREGEAISWHIREELKRQGALSGVDVARITFTEVTEKAVRSAFKKPRDLSNHLVDAYLARRALDYLVGFSLSPVLWRKLPGARSAGRVQSVALRLVCERETAVENHAPQEYWTIAVYMETQEHGNFWAQVCGLDGKNLSKQRITSKEEAKAVKERILRGSFMVSSVRSKMMHRSPPPPFTTSTLQQEASSKLNLSAGTTLSLSQRLYEGGGGKKLLAKDSLTSADSLTDEDGLEGMVTYMRTDSPSISEEIIEDIRSAILHFYGLEYLPKRPRVYLARTKNAQEAHEAIRPTDVRRTADQLPANFDNNSRKLYDLIFKRTLASQMVDAQLKQVTVEFSGEGGAIVLRSTATSVVFPGFMMAYHNPNHDANESDAEGEIEVLRGGGGGPMSPERRALTLKLESVKEGASAVPSEVDAKQSFTAPPLFYTEGSLVKALEEHGIGRPSTYASTINVLKARNYISKSGRQLHALPLGRYLVAFLQHYFTQAMDYEFTAQMEEKLDQIAGGQADWQDMVAQFWLPFNERVTSMDGVTGREVVDVINDKLASQFLRIQDGTSRTCPSCKVGDLTLKLTKRGEGVFIGCSNYPACKYATSIGGVPSSTGAPADSARLLGTDPTSDKPVYCKDGPYGMYVQLGENDDTTYGSKPARAHVPKADNVKWWQRNAPEADVDDDEQGKPSLEMALELLQRVLPVGFHPVTGIPILKKQRYRQKYLQYGAVNVHIPKDMDASQLSLEAAVSLVDKYFEDHPWLPQPQADRAGTSPPKKSQKGQSAARLVSKGKTSGRKETSKGKTSMKKKTTEGNMGTAKSVAVSVSDQRPRKRAANAFLVFCGETRDAVRANHPELSYREVVKKLGQLWQDMDDVQKSKYASKAKSQS